jgi:hypothetical protein
MKNTAFLLVCLAVIVNAKAQRVVTETFDNNKFQWEEFFEKTHSGSIADGYYILQNKEEGFVRCVTELPIDVERNFKITFKFLVPKINDEYHFGIIFNYEDENNYSNFLVQEKKYKMWNKKDGTFSLSRQSGIILKSGKNKEVVIAMEKKGTKLIFTVDNMEAVSITKKLNFNTFGFQVENANTIKIDEVSFEQIQGK